MRRLLSVVLATLLAALLLVPAAAAAAPSDAPAADVLVLAAEGGGGEPAGPEPMGPNESENTNAPADYEPPFLSNLAVLLTVALVLLVIGLGGIYWLLVQRPRQA